MKSHTQNRGLSAKELITKSDQKTGNLMSVKDYELVTQQEY